MLHLLHNINEDRKNLRELASNLLSVISSGNIAKNAFESFLSRTTLVHYQLQRVFLEKQRNTIENLEFKINSIESKVKSDSTTQTETYFSIPEPNWNLDFSIASDTTTSPINKSIDIVNLSQIEIKKGHTMDRALKKSFSRISALPVKPQKRKTEEPNPDKQLPPIRKNQLRKTGKS